MTHILETIQSSINIYLDSSEAFFTSGKEKKFFFTNPIECLPNHQMILELKSAIFPISMYNINSTNNRLFFNSHTATIIEEGNYDTVSLLHWCNQNLSGITVTFNEQKHKFVFTSSIGSFSLFTGPNNALKLFGFDDTIDHVSTGNILTSQNVVDLSGLKNIVIKLPGLSLGSRSSNQTSGDILAKIPISVNPGEVLFYENNFSVKHQVKIKLIESLTIIIEDESGNQIDFNGNDYYLELIVHFISEREYKQRFTHFDEIQEDLEIHHRIKPKKKGHKQNKKS